MTLEFEIAGLPKIFSNGSHGSWRGRYGEANKWKKLVNTHVHLSIGAGIVFRLDKIFPMKSPTLTLTRFSSVEPDFDGLVISFKNVIDGLVESGVIEGDKQSIIGQPRYLWERTKPRQGRIRVRVEAA